jgi:hypothetical protein
MMETAKLGDKAGFSYDTPQGVAKALLEGLMSDKLSVVRAGENSQGMIDSNREAPRELDKQIQEMKPKLEEAVANHRRM